jgi:LPXTG-motif cell wall-anchored protein
MTKSSGSASPQDQPEDEGSVVVYRTGYVNELDIVSEALSRAGIPYFRRMESIGGLSFAVPVMPAGGPGTLWAIVVPESWAERARHFIARLPVPQGAQPHVWSSPAPPPKTGSFSWGWLLVIGALLLLLWSMIRAFTE